MNVILEIDEVKRSWIVLEGPAFDFEEVLYVETTLPITSLDPNYDDTAFSELTEKLVEFMKANPQVDRVHVEHVDR